MLELLAAPPAPTCLTNTRWPDYADAYRWLARDPWPNQELLLVLLHELIIKLVVIRDGAAVTGVLVLSPHPESTRLCYRLDAHDAALPALLAAATDDLPWLIQRPALAAALTARTTLAPTGYVLHGYRCAAVAAGRMLGRPLHAPDVDLVLRSDCGWDAREFRAMLAVERTPWAIIADGRIVCRASCGYGTAWSEEVLGVWTAPAYRGAGLAQSLVRAISADVLRRRPWATYTTTAENLASQRVAAAAGFEAAYRCAEYLG